jgi:CO dehydrogenase maturation factor
MRIAFVGKGGSGKTTVSALFCASVERSGRPLLAIDADINMHLGEKLGFPPMAPDHYLSSAGPRDAIRRHLMGSNVRVAALAQFLKTTPPAKGSVLFRLSAADELLDRHALRRGTMRFMVVGTYSEEAIGASCYHTQLAILENILSHTVDDDGIIVVDMVAGVDAFANSLHAQFDLLVVVVEATRSSLDVYESFLRLAREAGVADAVAVVGNQIESPEDRAFLDSHIPADRFIGGLGRSPHVRSRDRDGGAFDISRLDAADQKVLSAVLARATASAMAPASRLHLLHQLHRRYIRQDSIHQRFGDLSPQIDPAFSYPQPARQPQFK